MSKILFHYAMFSNFNGIENGVFRRLSAHCIMDDSGPLKKCFGCSFQWLPNVVVLPMKYISCSYMFQLLPTVGKFEITTAMARLILNNNSRGKCAVAIPLCVHSYMM